MYYNAFEASNEARSLLLFDDVAGDSASDQSAMDDGGSMETEQRPDSTAVVGRCVWAACCDGCGGWRLCSTLSGKPTDGVAVRIQHGGNATGRGRPSLGNVAVQRRSVAHAAATATATATGARGIG